MLKEIIRTALGGEVPEVIEEVAERDAQTVHVWNRSSRATADIDRVHWTSHGAVWTPNTVMLGKVLQALHEKGYQTSLTRHRDGTNTVDFFV
jgi:hypothetical protein